MEKFIAHPRSYEPRAKTFNIFRNPKDAVKLEKAHKTLPILSRQQGRSRELDECKRAESGEPSNNVAAFRSSQLVVEYI